MHWPMLKYRPLTNIRLGCSPEFTEKLLLQSPGLLNALLVKATSSQREFDEVCLSLYLVNSN